MISPADGLVLELSVGSGMQRGDGSGSVKAADAIEMLLQNRNVESASEPADTFHQPEYTSL